MTKKRLTLIKILLVIIFVVPVVAEAEFTLQLEETTYIYMPLTMKNARGPLAGTTIRISIASDGDEGNGRSYHAAISSTGRYIAFVSGATDMVPDDTNGYEDVFVHDRQTGNTTLVSVASDGTQANNASMNPDISADGRYVVFTSLATNLISDDTNPLFDIFVHDLVSGETSLISKASDGTQGNGISFYSTISSGGRYVAFESLANNLVADDTNGQMDIFVHDQQSGDTVLVSVASDGTQSNGSSTYADMSSDGRFVSFGSAATNLVPDDTNGQDDIFVHDRQTGETTLISLAWDGSQGNGLSYYPRISADGRYVSFQSTASNLVSDDSNGDFDVFVHDRQTEDIVLVSKASDGTYGNGGSFHHAISGDGHTVAFISTGTNLVSGDTNGQSDVFVHDLLTGQTRIVSLASEGTQGNGDSSRAFISADGRYVVFDSVANNLVANDTNGVDDVFVHDLGV
jgi:hypothetical protein